MKTNKLGGRMWTTILLFGLFGQVAWIVENMYFNVFIDRTMSTNPFAVSIMVAASAICATVATLFGGIWSDKVGKRKPFMSIGYIVWGLIIMSFSLISPANSAKLFGAGHNSAIIISIVIVVIMDCVMSIIGSGANDACFNSWVTDNTSSKTRGRVDGVLSVMPLIAMALVFGGMDWMTQDTYKNLATGETRLGWASGWVKVGIGNWTLFYLLLGGVVIAIGILGLFLIKDSKTLVPNPTSKFGNFFYGFKLKVIKENKALYWCFFSLAIIGIANNSFMTFLIMYAERTLGFSNYIIPIAIIIVTAAVGSVLFGIFMDKKMPDRRRALIPLIIVYVVGAIGMLLASPICFKVGSTSLMITLCFVGFILMTANLCLNANLTATVRDFTPVDKIGMFQGVRMVFYVMIPMIIGPMITALINIGSPIVAQDTVNNIVIRNYTPYMFLVAGIIGAVSILPILKLQRIPLPQAPTTEE